MGKRGSRQKAVYIGVADFPSSKPIWELDVLGDHNFPVLVNRKNLPPILRRCADVAPAGHAAHRGFMFDLFLHPTGG